MPPCPQTGAPRPSASRPSEPPQVEWPDVSGDSDFRIMVMPTYVRLASQGKDYCFFQSPQPLFSNVCPSERTTIGKPPFGPSFSMMSPPLEPVLVMDQ